MLAGVSRAQRSGPKGTIELATRALRLWCDDDDDGDEECTYVVTEAE
jgi:hypothetical protein